MAEALKAIHRANITSSDTGKAPENTILFGRHGDIKPENILWFPDEMGRQSSMEKYVGVLRISDFGLTRFHKEKSRSRIATAQIGVSLTYRAPETDLHTVISRAYDIWSLGCVYLEFLTWLVLGWTGVADFGYQRMNENPESHFKDDAFFEVKKERWKTKAVVKTTVKEVRSQFFEWKYFPGSIA
jgi:serine/threonine protein kinase